MMYPSELFPPPTSLYQNLPHSDMILMVLERVQIQSVRSHTSDETRDDGHFALPSEGSLVVIEVLISNLVLILIERHRVHKAHYERVVGFRRVHEVESPRFPERPYAIPGNLLGVCQVLEFRDGVLEFCAEKVEEQL
jgi:hypothetical protein